MRSRFGHCVIAFLLTVAFLWWFCAVYERSLQASREEVLAQEEYQRFRQYVDENNLDYRKIKTVCLTEDTPEQPPMSFVMAMVCAMPIIPYSILLALVRRLAGRFSDSDTASGRASPPEEHFK